MNALSGRLDTTKNYKIIDGYYKPLLDGGGETCENCGALITDIAIISDDTDKNYHVGCDCAETLSKKELCINWELKELKKKINRRKRCISWIKKNLHTAIEYGDAFLLFDRDITGMSFNYIYRVNKDAYDKIVKMFAKKIIIEEIKK